MGEFEFYPSISLIAEMNFLDFFPVAVLPWKSRFFSHGNCGQLLKGIGFITK